MDKIMVSEPNPTELSQYRFESTAGQYPYRSGIHSEMYTIKPWTIRQYAGFGEAGETNKRFRELISAGVTGLSVAFDLPTQMGLDPDHPLSLGEVGRVGVSICHLQDMRKLLEDIPLDEISISMTINSTAPIILLMYQIVAEEQGVDLNKLRGTVQNDVLKEFIARGTQIFTPEVSLELTGMLFKYCVQNLPSFNPISVSGYHMEEAGASPEQEIGYAFANAIAYLNHFRNLGLAIDEIAPKFSFFFSSKISIIQEVAKFRAAREVWARIIHETFGSNSQRSMKMRFHTQTAGSELFANYPELNLSRVTLQALAAVLGGTQSLHTNSYDEAIALPSNYAAVLATQTQKVLLLESDLNKYVDPFEGSTVVEKLTDELVSDIFKIISEINDLGGAVEAVKQNYQKANIAKKSYETRMEIENGSRVFAHTHSELPKEKSENFIGDTWSWSAPEPDQLKQFKSNRDQKALNFHLNSITEAIALGNDVMFQIKCSLKVGATVGEIVEAIKSRKSESK
jgi:methylmalonyl-CoA mutase N-terminal domain/subunit